MKIFNLALIAVTLVIALAPPPAARAADGTTDIRIGPSSPVGISAPGSYRLVGDVTLTVNSTAITVTADNVTIDLGGHTITGAAVNFQLGIRATGQKNVTVMNGNFFGFGDSAIELGPRGVIRNVRAEGNNTNGGNVILSAGDHSTVEGCIVTGNSPAAGACTGISVGNGSMVERCIVAGNKPAAHQVTGISVGNGCRVIGCVVDDNDSANNIAYGILAGPDAVIEGNTVRGNTGGGALASSGVTVGTQSTIRNNRVTDNDNLGTGDAFGIYAGTDSHIEANVCSAQSTGSTGSGIATGISTGNSTIIGNDCYYNAAGIGSNGNGWGISGGSGSFIRGNRCEGNNGAGSGTSVGIVIISSCRVEGNHCRVSTGGAFGWGIRVSNDNNVVADNSTQGNGTAGLVFGVAANNRSERNRFRQNPGTGIDLVNGVAPVSAGTGDNADVTF